MSKATDAAVTIGVACALSASPTWAGCDVGIDTCKYGLVWRDAVQNDHVCVSGESRNFAAEDNLQGPQRREPQGGASGLDTCKQGWVWREVTPTDHVCVSGTTRTRTATENSAAAANRNSICAPLWGWADLHAHTFANEGFGGSGRVFTGRAFGPLDQALGRCDAVHGIGGINDAVGMVMHTQYTHNFRWGHFTTGTPDMAGWPRWDDLTHQQMHEDMLRRAVAGGMRLMVAHAVNNEWMCETAKNLNMTAVNVSAALLLTTGDIVGAVGVVSGALGTQIASSQASFFAGDVSPQCKDMPSVDRQIQEAYAMEASIDAKNGGRGQGWFRVVKSPEEARAVMDAGKLAVVLGIEVPALFGCYAGAQCTEDWVRQQIDTYYEKGVRHVFPMHFYDNDFGGSASSNLLVTNRWKNPLVARDCSALGYAYDGGRCNSKGLTNLGKFLIRELALRGMMIDTDHMSALSFNDTLNIMEPLHYPAVSSHSGFNEFSIGSKKSEGNKTRAEVDRIAGTGGMMAVIPHQGDLSEIGQTPGAVAHTCGNTSETVAQAYMYAKLRMPAQPVGIGTDFNGFASEPGPRFGPDACPGGLAPGTSAKPRLTYPIKVRSSTGSVELPKATVGTRTYDFNEDGLAHIGLLPDMIADFLAIGMQPSDLDPLLDSAAGYARLWDRARDSSRAVDGIRKMQVKISPSMIVATASQVVTLTVEAADSYLGDGIAVGDVFIKNVRVGALGVPFQQNVAGRWIPRKCTTEIINGKPKKVCAPAHWSDDGVDIVVRSPKFRDGAGTLLVDQP